MPTTNFRFLRTHEGVTCFARIALEVVSLPDRTGPEIDADPVAPTAGSGEVLPTDELDLFAAAREGIEAALDQLQTVVETRGTKVIVRKLIVSPVDTTPDAVRCAACLATYQVLAPDCEPPPVSEEPPWRIIT